MPSGCDMIEEYQKFLEEQQTCGGMMEQDQEVPMARTADGVFLKTDIKTEVDSVEYQQPHLINFFGMDDALGVSHAPNTSEVTVSNSTIWLTPFSNTSANSYCVSDCKDSLNTPTPYCQNAVNGLKWEPSLINDSNSSYQSPVHSSPLLSSTATSASTMSSMSSSQSSSSSSISSSFSSAPSLAKESFLLQESSSPSSFSSFSLSDARFDLTPPPFSRNSVSPSSSSSLSVSLSSTGSFLNELESPAAAPVSSTKTKTSFTNGLAVCGGTLVSNTVNFLEEPPHQALKEDILEYTDLDKQPFSMYEDFEMGVKQQNNNTISNNGISSGHVLDDPELLAGLHLIHDTLQKDCEELNIPFDPMLWTAEHVQCWVSTLCHKKNVPDVSAQLYPLDGPALYTMPDSVFQQYGEAGSHISFEIACCKAAKSVMHQETLPHTNVPVYIGTGSGQQARKQTTVSSPCVSPAPSNCSNSRGSSTGFSTPSDPSDDEAYFSSTNSEKRKASVKSSSASRSGRGIYLWQFLVELLVSGDPAHADCIRWIDRQRGIFKIEDSKKVASLWGSRKNRPMMNYDKLSRSVRQYYKKGIIKKTEQSRRLVYQFCESTLANIMCTAK